MTETPGRTQCLSCGYDTTSLSSRTCPECGYSATDADVQLRERQEVFIQTARVLNATVMLLLVMSTVLVINFRIWIFPVVFSGLATLGGIIVSRGWPRQHRRIFRYAWWCAAQLWVMPVVVCFSLLIIVGRWDFVYDTFYGHRHWLLILIGIELVAMAASVPLWFAAWRHLARVAGVPEHLRNRRTFRRGTLCALVPLAPPAILFFLGAVVFAAMYLLDRFVPGWYMS